VLAGMLIMIAVSSVDKWSITQFLRVRYSLGQRDFTSLANIIQMVTVVVALLVYGIFTALWVGIALAIIWFVLRMGKSVIRREFTMSNIRSNTIRLSREHHALDKAERRIHCLELEGSIFFGTASQICDYIEELLNNNVEFIIFEFHRVQEIDSTGANLIVQYMRKHHKKEGQFYLAGMYTGKKQYQHAELIGLLTENEKKQFIFPDLNTALAVAEDRLLDRILGCNRYGTELQTNQVYSLSALDAAQIRKLEQHMELKSYENGETVFEKDSPGDKVYFIVKGRARILIKQQDNAPIRLATLCTGNCFGEMAFIDNKPRSADVVSVGNMKCYILSFAELQKINEQQPDIGFALIKGVAKELARRIRFNNWKSAEWKDI
jgi:CRP-like cAMP-binding protein/anti-anti-sigma regulatory factor